MPEALRPGFIGLGAMGARMARNLASKWTRPLAVFDAASERLDEARQWNAVRCASPAEVAERSDVVFTMLPNDETVRAVALGESGVAAGAHSGLILADFSTIAPWTLLQVADGLSRRGGGKVLGGAATLGTTAAEQGKLAVFVDDYDGLLDRVRPLVACFASEVMATGGLASAKTMKLLNNLLVSVTVAATAEALVLGEKAGIPPEVAIPILLKGSGASYALKHHFAGAYLENALGTGRFPVTYMLKDLRLAQTLAQRSRHSMHFGSQAIAAYRGACALGYSDHYYPIVVRWMEHIAGLTNGETHPASRAA